MNSLFDVSHVFLYFIYLSNTPKRLLIIRSVIKILHRVRVLNHSKELSIIRFSYSKELSNTPRSQESAQRAFGYSKELSMIRFSYSKELSNTPKSQESAQRAFGNSKELSKIRFSYSKESSITPRSQVSALRAFGYSGESSIKLTAII